jgi:hypothetical protein
MKVIGRGRDAGVKEERQGIVRQTWRGSGQSEQAQVCVGHSPTICLAHTRRIVCFSQNRLIVCLARSDILICWLLVLSPKSRLSFPAYGCVPIAAVKHPRRNTWLGRSMVQPHAVDLVPFNAGANDLGAPQSNHVSLGNCLQLAPPWSSHLTHLCLHPKPFLMEFEVKAWPG